MEARASRIKAGMASDSTSPGQNNMEQMLCKHRLYTNPAARGEGWAGQRVTALCQTCILLLAHIWAFILTSLSNPARQIIKLGSIYPSYWISRLCNTTFHRKHCPLSNRTTLLAEDSFYPSGTCLGLSESKWPHPFAAIWTLRPTLEGQGVHRNLFIKSSAGRDTCCMPNHQAWKLYFKLQSHLCLKQLTILHHPPPPPPRWPRQACKLALWQKACFKNGAAVGTHLGSYTMPQTVTCSSAER